MKYFILLITVLALIGISFASCVDLDGDGYDNCSIGESGDDGLPIDCNDGVSTPNSCPTSGLTNEYVLYNAGTSPYDGAEIYYREERYSDFGCNDNNMYSWNELRFTNNQLNPECPSSIGEDSVFEDLCYEDCCWGSGDTEETVIFTDGRVNNNGDWGWEFMYPTVRGPDDWWYNDDYVGTVNYGILYPFNKLISKPFGSNPVGLYQVYNFDPNTGEPIGSGNGECIDINSGYLKSIKVWANINVAEAGTQIPQPTSTMDCNADTVEYPICINPGATEYEGDGVDSDCDGEDDPPKQCIYGDTSDDQECCTLGCETNNGIFADYSMGNYDSDYCDFADCTNGEFTIQDVFGTTDDPDQTNCLCDNNTGCTPGDTLECYTGPPGTQGVGQCNTGTRTCQDNKTWGPCEGETTPEEEICDNLIDEDCDGLVDEDCFCPMCTERVNDDCITIECENDSDCPGANCSCTPVGNCWYDEGYGITNSIDINATYTNQFNVTLTCTRDTNYALLNVKGIENNIIDANIYDSNDDLQSDLLLCDSNGENYTIVPNNVLETGNYTLTAEIPSPCNPCKDTIIIELNTDNSQATTIPDNNLLVVLVSLISLIGFMKIKNREEN